MKKFLQISMILLIGSVLLQGRTPENYGKIHDFLVKAYSQKYDVETSDISMKINHLPKTDLRNRSLQFIDKSQSLDLGHNSARLQILSGNNVQQEFRITYTAKIQIETPVLKNSIKYGDLVKESDLKMEKREIRYNYEHYYRSKNIGKGLVAKAMLREGEILRKQDIRTKPTINRGEAIDLVVKSGNIMIEMEGIAKEEGRKGEKIRVYNQSTRRHYFGIVKSPQTVVVNLD